MNISQNNILVEVRRDTEYGRNCLLGIAAYLRIHENFTVVHREPCGLAQPVSKHWKIAGVISDVRIDEGAAPPAEMNIPIVNLSGWGFLKEAVSVSVDEHAIVQLVLQHFVDRGFEHLGLLPLHYAVSGEGYGLAVAKFAASRGLSAAEYQAGDLHEWIKSLRLPIGIMACDDHQGQALLEVCRDLDIDVPEQIAIVVIEHDRPRCELCRPALSAVELDGHRAGFLAASVIGNMLGNQPLRNRNIVIPPLGLTIRGSSDGFVVRDAMIATAIRVIREKATGRMNVEKLLSHLPVSRATLERRFIKAMGHSPREQILRVRLERVRQLLVESDYDLATIARMSGFKTAAHLSVRFKARLGQSPGQYRAARSI